jgi:uncharacterized membrane protein YhaH (DUF805 family)
MFSRPFSFDGRIGRLEYFLSWLLYNGLLVGSIFIADYAGSEMWNLLVIPAIWFTLAQGAKRCHDLGSNGFFQIIPFYFFWMVFARGEEGNNDYGPPNGHGPTDIDQSLDSVLES